MCNSQPFRTISFLYVSLVRTVMCLQAIHLTIEFLHSYTVSGQQPYIEVDPENVDTRRTLWQASRELKTIQLVDISEETRPEVKQRNTGPRHRSRPLAIHKQVSFAKSCHKDIVSGRGQERWRVMDLVLSFIPVSACTQVPSTSKLTGNKTACSQQDGTFDTFGGLVDILQAADELFIHTSLKTYHN